jgi:hypothetical protein
MAPLLMKRNMFMIFGAFAIFVGMLSTVLPPLKMPLNPVSIGVSACGAAICIFYTFFKLLPAGNIPSVGRFQVNLMICLAGAELEMLGGTFMGSAPYGPWPFAIVSWALMFGGILPKMIAFWRTQSNT